MLTQLIKSFVLSPWVKPSSPEDALSSVSRKYTVWPYLIDFNLHLNNANYLKLMEHARWNYFLNRGWFTVFLKNRTRFVVAGCELGFYRELPVFTSFIMTTKLLTWNEKYMYFEHQLLKDDVLYCHAILKVATVRDKKLVKTEDACRMMNINYDSAPEFEIIEQWKALAQAKRHLNDDNQKKEAK